MYKLEISQIYYNYLLNEAVNNDIVIIRPKSFISNQLEKYISLKLNIISYEALSWILKSLMIDEMKPTMRTIMNRIKEVFGYKVDPFIINMLIESINGNELPKIPSSNIGKTLQRSIQQENSNFVFHNSDLKKVRTVGDIDDQTFKIIYEEDLNSGVSSIYFADEPQW